MFIRSRILFKNSVVICTFLLATAIYAFKGHLLVLFKMQPLCPACLYFIFMRINDDDEGDKPVP